MSDNRGVQAPSGVVTLLFTDIEGSTRLWDDHPDEMTSILERHDRILRTHLEDAGGFVFKTIGDAFCASFASAADAVVAAVAIQRTLADTSWPEDIELKVRIGLHTGACHERDGDYFGPVVNRTARLESIASGGQVLLSAVTAAAAIPLPPSASLQDLGDHRLKDLGRPEHVFQLVADGLPRDFAPLRSLDNPGLAHNLPYQVSSFIGRERQLEEIAALIDQSRLVTLVGAGGCGKSRLALQVGADQITGSGDGVWLVELAAISDPSLVPATMMSVLGIREEPGVDATETLVRELRDRRLLLIVDNCEHMIDASAKLAHFLLQSCPGVHLLATSREPLAVSGETVYRVPAMAVPPPGLADPGAMMGSEAVRLFVERSTAADRAFELTASNAAAVGSIARHLDGIPLAIELAAVRLRAMSVQEIHARLDQRFTLLGSGTRQPAEHQRTLRATIDWSYDLLNDTERLVLDRTAVFLGGWNLAAAEAVTADDRLDAEDVLTMLMSLVDKSLVQADPNATHRYDLLETIRHYTQERLAARGEDEVAHIREAHSRYYRGFAENADAGLDTAEADQWLRLLELEQENLRAALTWCLDHDPPAAVQLVGSLARYWDERGSVLEGEHWVQAALDAGRAESTPAQVARALWAAGLMNRSNMGESRAQLEAALALARDADAPLVEAAAALGAARTARIMGDYDTALALAGEARELYRGLHHLHGEVGAVEQLAFLSLYLGSFDEVQRFVAEADKLVQRAGNWRGMARLAAARIVACDMAGDPARGRALIGQALDLAERMGDQRDLAFVLEAAGGAHRDCGDFAVAAEFMRRALELSIEPSTDLLRVTSVVFHAGALLVRAADPWRGAALMAAERRLAADVQVQLPPGFVTYFASFEGEARAQLDDEAWAQAGAVTDGLTAEEVAGLAMEWLALVAEEDPPA